MINFRTGLVSFAIFAFAGAAHAWAPGPVALAVLASGEAWSEVLADPGRSSGVVYAAVDIAAPPAAVWKVLVDCSRAPTLVVNLKSCRVLERDPRGRWDVREHVSKGGVLPGVRSTFRAEYDAPRLVTYHRVAGDLKVLDGSWRLEPLDGGRRTRVIYETHVSAGFVVPAPLVRATLRRDVPKTLANLRDACVAR